MDTVASPDPDPVALAPEMPREAVAGTPARLMSPPASSAASRLGWRTGIALGILAFLAGLAVMALVASRYGVNFGGAKPVATVMLPVGPGGQQPVVILPGKSAAALPAIDLAALSGRETELSAKLAQLETRGGAIDRSSSQAAHYATRAEGLMIAFAARRALDRGLTLGFLEDQLRTRFGTTQPRAVAAIVQAAREPVTLEDLRSALDGVAPELMTGAASTGWWTSFRRELGGLVVLRKAGTPSPLPVDRVARARRLLEAGLVEAALAEVARTPGAAAAGRWTGAARRYIGARAALDTIESAAILATDREPPAPVTPPADVPGLGTTPPDPEIR